MFNWRHKMPAGMLLKSDGFASNLDDPDKSFTLKAFCRAQGLAYADDGAPVPAANFIAYGEAFQRRFVPHLEDRLVVTLDQSPGGFVMTLDDGEIVRARNVVMAIGVSDFPYVPAPLTGLPPEFVSHASYHGAMDAFRGREVAVIGSGSSATDIAALLHENGASARLIARRSQLRFHTLSEARRGARKLMEQLRSPPTGIGPGWRHLAYTRAPQLFWHLPEDIRFRIVKGTLGPAGGWFMRDRVIGKLPVMEGLAPRHAAIKDGRIQLDLTGPGGDQTVSADHVISATGYQIDVRAIGFLGKTLRDQIKTVEHAPVLSRQSETSVRGLYVIGPAAAFSFGPVLRFVFGVKSTIPPLARHLSRSVARSAFVPRPELAKTTEMAG
jgi:thioredoxin reductase